MDAERLAEGHWWTRSLLFVRLGGRKSHLKLLNEKRLAEGRAGASLPQAAEGRSASGCAAPWPPSNERHSVGLK